MRDIVVLYVRVREGSFALGRCRLLPPVWLEVSGFSVCGDWRVRKGLHSLWRIPVIGSGERVEMEQTGLGLGGWC